MEGPDSHGERNQIVHGQREMKLLGVRAQPSPQTMQLCNSKLRSRIDGLREALKTQGHSRQTKDSNNVALCTHDNQNHRKSKKLPDHGRPQKETVKGIVEEGVYIYSVLLINVVLTNDAWSILRIEDNHNRPSHPVNGGARESILQHTFH
jgi:hypothetical protein